MKRFTIEKLEKWACSPHRKPLVLSGARQVGKTWLLREFGKTHFARTAYVNFDRHPELAGLFEGTFDFRRILTGLQVASGVPIEAKAERNLQAKSLGVYRRKFAPARAIRTSLADMREEDGLLDIPLYALAALRWSKVQV